jgi:protein TonB
VYYPEAEPDSAVPKFLVVVPGWRQTFFSGLGDLLLGRFRRRRRLLLTSRPAAFWLDVFVDRRVPPSTFAKSVVLHLFVVLLVWTSQQSWLVRPPAVEPRNPMQNTVLIYYPISEYLPPIKDHELTAPAKVARKGDPAPARQRIVSSPRQPDNARQTIGTPSPPVLEHEPMLPNFVINTPYLPEVPTSAARDLHAKLTLPPELLAVEPPPVVPPGGKVHEWDTAEVAPPPPVVERTGRWGKFGQPEVVEPPPKITAEGKVRAFPTPAVVEPPPEANRLRPLGVMNLARVGPKAAALAVAEQQAVPPPPNAGDLARLPARGSKAASAAAGPGVGSVVAPALSSKDAATMGGNSARTAGQLVALGVRPALPGQSPLEIPQGNRRGQFGASPEGTPHALGTPDIPGGGKKNGTGERSQGPESTIAGITIGAGPVNPGAAVVGATNAYMVIPVPLNKAPSAFAAAIRPQRPEEIARETRPNAAPQEVSMQDTIFNGKRYYSMVLNMPNLSSMRGSWVMHFAELHESGAPGELTAPVAIVKIDPAYPAEMMRTRLEGTVMLYAVIRTDGRVENVRVLRGVEARLDANAVAALSRWRFQPARKNGVAVAAEAVVQIPFQATAGVN